MKKMGLNAALPQINKNLGVNLFWTQKFKIEADRNTARKLIEKV